MSWAVPTNFVQRLVGKDLAAAASLLNKWPQSEEVAPDAVRAELAAAVEAEPQPDESLCLGSDRTAKVIAHFARHSGSDARTLRTLVDVLLLLDPAPDMPELWLCLESIIRRFAPVARLPESGNHLVDICQLFDSLILFHDPELAIVLKHARVGSETYCIPWLLTAHAVGLAEQHAALYIWDCWLEEGEPLDPIFLGLARLHMCREELLLCGPVPELAQLLQASLSAKQHASEAVLDAALEHAADFKANTPLSFLKRLQHALLRPKAAAQASEEEMVPTDSLTQQATSGTKSAGLGNFASRAGSFLRRKVSGQFEQPVARQLTDPITCMRVEAQDVMMFETVRERHMERVLQMGQSQQGTPGTESTGVEALRSRSSSTGTCRLVPRLIDLRPPLETARLGVKSCYCIDVARKKACADFAAWAEKRAADMQPYQLRPMHVLMTSSGNLSAEQHSFLQGVLKLNVKGMCVLIDGYNSLEPFFVDDGPAAPLVEEKAREMLHKGMAGVASWWSKRPGSSSLKEQVMDHALSRTSAAGSSAPEVVEEEPQEDDDAGTFEREAAPPVSLEDGALSILQGDLAAAEVKPVCASPPPAEADATSVGQAASDTDTAGTVNAAQSAGADAASEPAQESIDAEAAPPVASSENQASATDSDT
mmetsp:Transcript_38030/g.88933  ORF Transcript_38030/g.88933 Transcript_38030/m.88933 type:complete len:652 (-) Transcript_38030:27-1982(-)